MLTIDIAKIIQDHRTGILSILGNSVSLVPKKVPGIYPTIS